MTNKWEPRLNQGGLMRCCIATIDEIASDYFAAETEPEDNTVFDCKYEEPGNRSILYKDETFQWNREEKNENSRRTRGLS
jgi:hypothetical protein